MTKWTVFFWEIMWTCVIVKHLVLTIFFLIWLCERSYFLMNWHWWTWKIYICVCSQHSF